MKKDDIKKIYTNKIKELNKHNNLYYEKSKPIISDAKFDELKNEIINLEKKYTFLKSKISPNNAVGFTPSKMFEKHKHKVPMLSLSNAFNSEDLHNFEKKFLII